MAEVKHVGVFTEPLGAISAGPVGQSAVSTLDYISISAPEMIAALTVNLKTVVRGKLAAIWLCYRFVVSSLKKYLREKKKTIKVVLKNKGVKGITHDQCVRDKCLEYTKTRVTSKRIL